MSSTTDRSGQRGQVLVLFAGGLVTLLLVAALAYDVGMVLLERRDQQNAADAAALAGARFVDPTQTFHGTCAAPGGNAAVIAACDIAIANDFDDNASDEDVFVDIPPVHAEEAIHRTPWNIEVRIATSRASLFAGVIGQSAWPVGAMAIASSPQDVLYPFGMLALNESACKAMQFSGSGIVEVHSSIQSNSTGEDCSGDPYGFSRTGGATVTATGACRAVGDIQDPNTSGDMICDGPPQPFSFPVPDPLRKLQAPAQPGLAASLKEWVAGPALITPANADIPEYCPGRTTPVNKAPDADDPHLCTLGTGSDAGRVFVLSPGLYPGGLDLKGGVTVYLLPGIYWIGGGGFSAENNVSVISVDNESDTTKAVCTEGDDPPCVGGGGILIYNSKLSESGQGAPGKITMGGGGATLSLMPYSYPFPENPDGSGLVDIVIFQDRTVSLGGDDVTLNGSTADAAVRGVVYLPEGDLKINGSTSTFELDQVIAQTFTINGSGGTIKVLEELGVDAVFSAAGLVE